jgi:hypothetical protein
VVAVIADDELLDAAGDAELDTVEQDLSKQGSWEDLVEEVADEHAGGHGDDAAIGIHLRPLR